MNVLAHSSRGGWSPRGDCRCLVDNDLGLFLVADGTGPTYGGYHEPSGLDPGLGSFRATFASSHDPEPARSLGALSAAHETMKRLCAEHDRSPSRSLCHFAAGVTACSVQASGALCFVQIGGGRAYLMRDGRLHLVVKDHALLTRIASGEVILPERADEISTLPRHVLIRLLGMGDPLLPDVAQEHWSPGDAVLVCTEGAWNHDRGDEVVLRLLAAAPDEFRRLLDATAWECGLDAAAIRLSTRDA
ncbi:hypothetical protein WMF18_39665 [Sorangium sp. So ce315]|uniref:PP2C family protein-serine/threonine phosphatase n=1 Tax=Sorangium sp. So ce315 TaxID=3133299 RepID=UPI003F626A7C